MVAEGRADEGKKRLILTEYAQLIGNQWGGQVTWAQVDPSEKKESVKEPLTASLHRLWV